MTKVTLFLFTIARDVCSGSVSAYRVMDSLRPVHLPRRTKIDLGLRLGSEEITT